MKTILTALVLALTALPALAGTVSTAPTDKGIALVDEKGMTLYIFDKDDAGKTACVDGCAANWPPLAATASDKAMGEYSIIARPDGSKQWAYRGKPLYRWIKDGKAGDTTGDGFRDLWHIARP